MQRNEHLRLRRIERNWRQQDLADQLGVTIVTIQRWERGAQQPSAYYRVKLCHLFGLSVQELGLVEVSLPSRERLAFDAAQAVSAPSEEPLLWTVPYARNPHFTGRDDLLQQLEQVFAEEQPDQPGSIRQAALTQTQAIKGLGGIGKTQIAVEYAYRARLVGRYSAIFWIAAGSLETILTSFVELAPLLPAVISQGETNPHTIVAAILRWLEQRVSPWLLIFDNADDLSLVQPYLPRQGNGNILLTTRANAVGALAASIEVDTMGIIEGTQLLLRRAHRVAAQSPEDLDEVINIVVALAQFPLALDQAGAYIEETGCSLSDYLQLYQRYRHALLARRGRQATGYPESVVTTWSLSFAQVERTTPAAAELLHLCALLAPDHIPEELLTQGAPHWPLLLQQAVADSLIFNQLLETLLAFSLVKRLSEDRMLSIHRLVQAVQLDRMDAEAQRAWGERLVRAVQAVFPQDPKDVGDWPQCLRYLDQVEACTAFTQQHQLLLPEAADLFDRTGTYFLEHTMYAQAESLYQRALTIRERLFGPEHPDTATSLNRLALLQRANGNYTQAEPLFQRALAIREQQLGPLHLDTAESLHGLARLYESQRAFTKAEPLFQRALAIREQQLGPLHLDTAESLNSLAILYFIAGRYEEAEPLYQRALAIREQQLGPWHYLTGGSLNNLAIIYAYQGRYTDAELLYQRVLAIWEQLFGSFHFNTAMAMHNLAELYTNQGRYEDAEPLCQRALAIYEQHLGPLHAHTADCLTGLARLSLKMGKDEQVESLAQRALRIHEEHLGALHPYVANDLTILASLYRDQGKFAEAEPLLLRALYTNEQALVSTHPQAADTLYEFALLRQAQGHGEEARSFFERALAARTHTLGAAHPLTLETRQRSDALLGGVDRTEEAAQPNGAHVPRSSERPREAAPIDTSPVSQEQSTTLTSTSERMRVACPQCHQTAVVLKSGKNRAGSQRFRCRVCQVYFTPEPIPRQPDPVLKAAALALAKQGKSYRSIARQLGVHHQTVSAWLSTQDAHEAE